MNSNLLPLFLCLVCTGGVVMKSNGNLEALVHLDVPLTPTEVCFFALAELSPISVGRPKNRVFACT